MNTELLWGFLVKGIVIVSLAGASSLFLRNSSGARRHLVWLTALVSLLLLPLAALPLPTWTVAEDTVPMVASLMAPSALKATPASAPISTKVTAPNQPTEEPAKSAPIQPPIDLKPILFNLWLIVCATILAWTAIGMVRVAWFVAISTPARGKEGKPQEGSANKLVIAQAEANKIRVLICSRLSVPATTGVLRPVILLPQSSSEWDTERLKMVLAHETAHIKRKDWLWQTLSQLACAIHCLNPLVWIAASQMRRESEAACDDFVISQGIEPTSYAQELLDIARNARFELVSSVSMARNKSVEHRLASVLDTKRNRKRVPGYALFVTIAVGLLFAVPIAILQAGPGLKPKVPGVVEPKPKWARHLPEIPSIPSTQLQPNLYLAKDGIAGLPNGFRVRLVGVGRQQGDLWGLDGKPLPDANNWQEGGPYWQGNVFHMGNPTMHSGDMGRFFVVELQTDRNVDAGVTSCVSGQGPLNRNQKENPTFAGMDLQLPEVPIAKNDPTYALIRLDIPKPSESTTYRFATAGTDWKTVATLTNSVKTTITNPHWMPSDSIQLNNDPKILIASPAGQTREIKLLAQGRLSDKDARRVILYDKAGEIIPFPQDPMFGPDGYINQAFKPSDFNRIDKIVLQTSPYIWAEFRNVPLHPNFESEQTARLTQNVIGTATGVAEGFTKSLSNGVTVAVTSVQKAVLDGDN